MHHFLLGVHRLVLAALTNRVILVISVHPLFAIYTGNFYINVLLCVALKKEAGIILYMFFIVNYLTKNDTHNSKYSFLQICILHYFPSPCEHHAYQFYSSSRLSV